MINFDPAIESLRPRLNRPDTWGGLPERHIEPLILITSPRKETGCCEESKQ